MPPPNITQLTPDPDNANRGTARGRELLVDSIAETGLGRTVLADKNGLLIAGNKTFAAAVAAGITKIQYVETTGDTLVVVQRTDLNLDTDAKARKLALLDNRTNEVDLDLDPHVVQRQARQFNFQTEEVGISDDELTKMLKSESAAETPTDESVEGTEYDETADDLPRCTCPGCNHTFIRRGR